MACLSLGFLLNLCIWIIVIAALVAIIRVVIPWLMGLMGGVPTPVVQIINIVIWALIAIAAVYIIFGLLSCLFGAGLHFPALR